MEALNLSKKHLLLLSKRNKVWLFIFLPLFGNRMFSSAARAAICYRILTPFDEKLRKCRSYEVVGAAPRLPRTRQPVTCHAGSLNEQPRVLPAIS